MSDKIKAEKAIAFYYDKNTPRFLRHNPLLSGGAIHRRLYPEGTNKKTDPSHYSESLVSDLIQKISARRILDLGCGVGGSIRYLKKRCPGDYTGITLSPIQCRIAEQQNTQIELGNYLDSSWYRDRKAFDLVYAIESLQHNPDLKLLLKNLISVLNKGSHFVVIDDFLIDGKKLSPAEEKLADRFRKHWHAYGYTSGDEFITTLEAHGFKLQYKSDLSSLMRKPVLNRFLRRAYLDCLSLLPFRNPALDNALGGGSLKLLQQSGLSAYYILVFIYGGD